MDAFVLLQTALLLELLNPVGRSPINVSDLRNYTLNLGRPIKEAFLPSSTEAMLRVFILKCCDRTLVSDLGVCAGIITALQALLPQI